MLEFIFALRNIALGGYLDAKSIGRIFRIHI